MLVAYQLKIICSVNNSYDYINEYDEIIIKTVVYIHDRVLLSKENESMPFAGKWMKLDLITLKEVSQTEKDKYHLFSLKCRI
jgi:hypothetical protein